MKHSFGHHFSLRTRVILPSVNRYTGFLLFHSICRSFQKRILRERKMEHHRELRQQIGHNCRKCSVFFPIIYVPVDVVLFGFPQANAHISIVTDCHYIFSAVDGWDCSMLHLKWTSVNFEITYCWHVLLSIWTVSNEIKDRNEDELHINSHTHTHIRIYTFNLRYRRNNGKIELGTNETLNEIELEKKNG